MLPLTSAFVESLWNLFSRIERIPGALKTKMATTPASVLSLAELSCQPIKSNVNPSLSFGWVMYILKEVACPLATKLIPKRAVRYLSSHVYIYIMNVKLYITIIILHPSACVNACLCMYMCVHKNTS